MSYVIQLLSEHLASAATAPLSFAFLVGAVIWFGLCATVLFVVDIREHRLPNRWTALLFLGGTVLLLATTLLAPIETVLADRWLSILIGSAVYVTVMFVLHLLTRGGIGMGDVKLAAGLGLYTGFIGMEAVVAGFVLAFIFGGLQALYLVVFHGAKKSTRLAFGPAMIIGCLVTLLM